MRKDERKLVVTTLLLETSPSVSSSSVKPRLCSLWLIGGVMLTVGLDCRRLRGVLCWVRLAFTRVLMFFFLFFYRI